MQLQQDFRKTRHMVEHFWSMTRKERKTMKQSSLNNSCGQVDCSFDKPAEKTSAKSHFFCSKSRDEKEFVLHPDKKSHWKFSSGDNSCGKTFIKISLENEILPHFCETEKENLILFKGKTFVKTFFQTPRKQYW